MNTLHQYCNHLKSLAGEKQVGVYFEGNYLQEIAKLFLFFKLGGSGKKKLRALKVLNLSHIYSELFCLK